METMAAAPTASVPKAFNDWGETMAAYRFFDNDSVEWQTILEPNWAQTERCMAQESVVLCLQDTTELDFNGQHASGLGPLSYEAQRGMYVHPTYAVTTAREPLGILDVWMRARAQKDSAGHLAGPKESLRWIESYERLAELVPKLTATRLMYVADREADMLPLMTRARDLGCPVDWLVRAAHNRCLPNSEKLWPHTTEGAALGEIEFKLAARPGSKAHVARKYDAPAGAKPIE